MCICGVFVFNQFLFILQQQCCNVDRQSSWVLSTHTYTEKKSLHCGASSTAAAAALARQVAGAHCMGIPPGRGSRRQVIGLDGRAVREREREREGGRRDCCRELYWCQKLARSITLEVTPTGPRTPLSQPLARVNRLPCSFRDSIGLAPYQIHKGKTCQFEKL